MVENWGELPPGYTYGDTPPSASTAAARALRAVGLMIQQLTNLRGIGVQSATVLVRVAFASWPAAILFSKWHLTGINIQP